MSVARAPPKPWERAGAGAASSAVASPPTTTTTTSSPAPATASAASTNSAAPALPDRPATLGTSGTVGAYGQQAAGAYGSRYGATTSPYGSTMSSYGSPYSRYGSSMGGYGGMSSYGGLGGYGGMSSYGMGGLGGMGGMGYGMGGMGGMGYGMGGPGMVGPDGVSLSQRMEAGTAATFQLIQSIVGAVGGFAQMLESTFMATHSSFFAMIGVAEQFGALRNYLGQVLSIFALIRWVRGLINRLLGRPPPAADITAEDFRDFAASGQAGSAGQAGAAIKMSKKPLIVFFLTVVGLPWLMAKLVRMINARQEEEARLRAADPNYMQQPMLDQFGRPLPGQPPLPAAPLDPSSLTFVRALYPYEAQTPEELSMTKDAVVAVLTPEAERATSGWWQGRLRDGTIGYFPSNYVQVVPSKGAAGKGDALPAAPSTGGDGKPAKSV